MNTSLNLTLYHIEITAVYSGIYYFPYCLLKTSVVGTTLAWNSWQTNVGPTAIRRYHDVSLSALRWPGILVWTLGGSNKPKQPKKKNHIFSSGKKKQKNKNKTFCRMHSFLFFFWMTSFWTVHFKFQGWRGFNVYKNVLANSIYPAQMLYSAATDPSLRCFLF